MRVVALNFQALGRRIAQRAASIGRGEHQSTAYRLTRSAPQPLGGASVRCVSTTGLFRDLDSQAPSAPVPPVSTASAQTEPAKGKKKQPKPPAPEVDPIDVADLRIGVITNVEHHPDATSLYVLQVDIGETSEDNTPISRTIVSGLVKFYAAKELLHKRVVVFANIKPSKLRGIKSEGMLLAASNMDTDDVVVELLEAPKSVVPGESVVAVPVGADAGSVVPVKEKAHRITMRSKKLIDGLISGLSLTRGVAKYQDRVLQTTQGIAVKPRTMVDGKIS